MCQEEYDGKTGVNKKRGKSFLDAGRDNTKLHSRAARLDGGAQFVHFTRDAADYDAAAVGKEIGRAHV